MLQANTRISCTPNEKTTRGLAPAIVHVFVKKCEDFTWDVPCSLKPAVLLLTLITWTKSVEHGASTSYGCYTPFPPSVILVNLCA